MFTFSYILSKVHTILIFSLISSIKCIIIGNEIQGWLLDYQLLETEKLSCGHSLSKTWDRVVVHPGSMPYGLDNTAGLYPSSSDTSAQVKAPSNPQCLLCGTFGHHHWLGTRGPSFLKTITTWQWDNVLWYSCTPWQKRNCFIYCWEQCSSPSPFTLID
jgi:hypothetical protein